MTEKGVGNGADRIAAQVEKIKKEASFGLLNTVLDIQDTLTSLMTDSPEKTAAETAYKALQSFVESNPKIISVTPRRIRDEDRKKLLPGQHAGISLQFALGDGNLLRVNVYGGLRGFVNEDMRDSDQTLRHLHSQRTDQVLSQATQINWHIKRPDDTTQCDVWIKKTATAITLDKLFYEGERIDIMSSANQKTYGFKKMTDALSQDINNLIKIIPSNV